MRVTGLGSYHVRIEETRRVEKTILIVGGYGQVGGRIAANLSGQFDGQIILAGRNPGRCCRSCRAAR